MNSSARRPSSPQAGPSVPAAHEPAPIALVLATYNRAAPLERLLQALERQTIARPRPSISFSTIVAVDAFTPDNGGTEVSGLLTR